MQVGHDPARVVERAGLNERDRAVCRAVAVNERAAVAAEEPVERLGSGVDEPIRASLNCGISCLAALNGIPGHVGSVPILVSNSISRCVAGTLWSLLATRQPPSWTS